MQATWTALTNACQVASPDALTGEGWGSAMHLSNLPDDWPARHELEASEIELSHGQ